jgi:uncharacterized protein DUF6262
MAEHQLALVNRRKREAHEERVRRALAGLRARGEPISFQAIARAAGVSRGYVYANSGLKAAIAAARDEQPDPTGRENRSATEASLQARVRALLEENRRLRAELQDMRAELAVLFGEARERDREATSGS